MSFYLYSPKFYLKLRDYDKYDRYIFFSYLEENPMTGKEFPVCEKWKYAKQFDSRERAEDFKEKWDLSDSYKVVDNLHESK